MNAVNPLAHSIASGPIDSTIRQKWQDHPYCLIRPAVREILKSHSGLSEVTVLGGCFDATVLQRLSLGSDIDYSRFRIGFGKTFGLRSDQIQIDSLKEVDQHTVRGLLRVSARFNGLDGERQRSLLAEIATANWLEADSILATEVGQQASDEVHRGVPEPSTMPTLVLKDNKS
jgi:hypothetical protein